MKQFKAIQGFNFREQDILVDDILALSDDEAKELIEAGKVVEASVEQPDIPPPPPAE